MVVGVVDGASGDCFEPRGVFDNVGERMILK